MTHTGLEYGSALYSLACEEGLGAELLPQLKTISELFAAEPDFVRLLSAPNLSAKERASVLDSCFAAGAHPYVLNTLKLMCDKRCIRHFSDCCAAYEEAYNRDHGILPVTAVSARPLTDGQQARLRRKLEELTGKTVVLRCRCDESVLGGLRLDYDGKRVDDTLRHRLDAIHSLLTGAPV